ncbi:MAG: helix-turn-helix domain-containing protein, partial [Clostridia bacterium]|nr:helix-turn-helix domain-containing protein [Clostridia bacterium]
TNEAIKLLRISKLSVGEVAEALGFSTVKSFSMFFKRNTGFTPSEFRKCTK